VSLCSVSADTPQSFGTFVMTGPTGTGSGLPGGASNLGPSEPPGQASKTTPSSSTAATATAPTVGHLDHHRRRVVSPAAEAGGGEGISASGMSTPQGIRCLDAGPGRFAIVEVLVPDS
jgi:hypothetical protein